MLNRCSQASGASHTCGIELKTIWDVDASSGYDNTKNWTSPGHLIAIRTLKGRGELSLSELGEKELSGSSLIVVEQQKIKRYFCAGKSWRFWWFEFDIFGTLPFPLHSVIDVPAGKEDNVQFAQCRKLLPRQRFARRALASAIFAAMLCRWIASWEGELRQNPHRKAIDKVIDAMHGRLDGFSVKEMAAVACLGERRFRQVFAELTGKSPKTFYDELRLRMGEALLRQGVCNIGETADRLGFSSQFHFSRAFRTYFGYPPSRGMICRR